MGTYSDPEKILGPLKLPVKHQAKRLLGKWPNSEAKSRNRARLPPLNNNKTHTFARSSFQKAATHKKAQTEAEFLLRGSFPEGGLKISKIHRDLLGPSQDGFRISPSNQVSGTRSHKLFSIGKSTNRDRVCDPVWDLSQTCIVCGQSSHFSILKA